MDDKFLNNLTIYIEVFTSEGTINSSKIFTNKLEKMGAVISKTFTNSVDLIVFKDGYLSTYNKAKKKEILLVSPLWVHKCESQNEKVDPQDFPASEINEALFSNRTPLDKLLGSRKKSRRRKTLNPLNTPSWHKSEKKIHSSKTDRKMRNLKRVQTNLNEERLIKTIDNQNKKKKKKKKKFSKQSKDEQGNSVFQNSKKHPIKQLFTDLTNTSDSQKSDFFDLNSNLNFNIFPLNGNLKEKKTTKKMRKDFNETFGRDQKITKKPKKNKDEGEEKGKGNGKEKEKEKQKRKEKQKEKDREIIKQKKKTKRFNSNNSNFFHLNNSPSFNPVSTPRPRFKRSCISTPVPINRVKEDQKLKPNTPKLKKFDKQNMSNKKQAKKKNRLRDTTNQTNSINDQNGNKIQTPHINRFKKRRNAQLNTPTKQLGFQFDFESLVKSVKKSQKKRRKKRFLKQK
ncbi:microcephalin [Anaeramoeba flamelloides]|uniref:Microcephalin n=1 Tax=Anaeramoeba flamelloides TaxID=1746091 RepID=A0AAV7ZEP4_9EUKA|nr:microcephalin [Anaeramoeba flamelloides]